MSAISGLMRAAIALGLFVGWCGAARALELEASLAANSTAGLGFVPIAPCRVADTRPNQGFSWPYGPPAMFPNTSRDIAVPAGKCGIPSGAAAYSVNVTVVPGGPLSYLTLWPTGEPRPVVSTLNAFDGQVTSNAAIVPAGANGSISVFVTHSTDLIMDVNGYFTDSGSEPLVYRAIAPCRLADTRPGSGLTGLFGAPGLAGGAQRDFPVGLGDCGIPPSARAYALNATVVPPGALGYLTLWPAGSTRPWVSTLNSFDGAVKANAAIVPAGNGGAISAFASEPTDLILDVVGYFAPPATLVLPVVDPGLPFHPVRPCRILDTRAASPSLFGGEVRRVDVLSSACGIPSTAQAYSLNVTVLPYGRLDYLTLWPWQQAFPAVSTLNSFSGAVVANAAIVPAGAGGAIGVYVTNPTHLILDINGYFSSAGAPPPPPQP